MEELSVDCIIISKQKEESDNYKKFREIVNKKRIRVINVVNMSNDSIKKIEIEKDLYFFIIWPKDLKLLNEKALNNNSLVCKLQYKEFSMLFTGDIEKLAENKILQEYKNSAEVLKSTVLKVAHHGSNTSSSKEFLNKVNPKIALIGVGKNNKFGHPNDEIIKRLEDNKIQIYRTDIDGEISIKVNKKGNINNIERHIKNRIE